MDEKRITPEDVAQALTENCVPFMEGRASTYVYFITDGEYVKIGKGFPNQRIRQMQTSNARELTVLFTVPVSHGYGNKAETIIHHMFRDWLVRGEWYDLADVIDAEAFREKFGCDCEVFGEISYKERKEDTNE